MSKIILRPGDEVLIETKNGKFSGRLKLKDKSVVYLYDVMEVASQRHIIGLKSFHRSEIISSRIINSVMESSRTNKEPTMNMKVEKMFGGTEFTKPAVMQFAVDTNSTSSRDQRKGRQTTTKVKKIISAVANGNDKPYNGRNSTSPEKLRDVTNNINKPADLQGTFPSENQQDSNAGVTPSSDNVERKMSTKISKLRMLIESLKASGKQPNLSDISNDEKHEPSAFPLSEKQPDQSVKIDNDRLDPPKLCQSEKQADLSIRSYGERPEHSAFSEKQYHISNYVIIDSIDSVFHSSIMDLKTSKTVSVAFVGSSIGCGTDFSWIVTHSNDVYLYDISSLGKSAFDEGLREVFQDANIVKMVYDCRVASHTLLHVHGTFLVNVLDLMALDYMADSFFGMKISLSKTMNPLLTSVACNLTLEMQEISLQKRRLQEAEKDPSYWSRRCRPGDPSHDDDYQDMLQAAIFEAVHLKQLKNELMNKLISPAIDATDFFLSCYRDMSGLQLPPKDVYAAPKEFQDGCFLKQAAQLSRDKTAKLSREKGIDTSAINGHVSSDGSVDGNSDLVDGSQVDSAASSLSSISPEPRDDPSYVKREGRKLLSRLMQESTEEKAINFAPCGAEVSFSKNSSPTAKAKKFIRERSHC